MCRRCENEVLFLPTFDNHTPLFSICHSSFQKDPKSISTPITVDTSYKYIEPRSGCGAGICPVPEYEQTGAKSYNNEKEVCHLRQGYLPWGPILKLLALRENHIFANDRVFMSCKVIQMLLLSAGNRI